MTADIEEILSTIMPAEMYAESRHETPYIFDLHKDNKSLLYFGTRHIRDPKSPLLSEISGKFKLFTPDVVFVEGISVPEGRPDFNRRLKEASEDEVVERMGESGFLAKMAVEADIDWLSPEPTDAELYKYLLEEGFTRDEIAAWNLFHILPQYNRQLQHEGFEKYAEPFIAKFREATSWPDFDYSYQYALQAGEKIIGKTIDTENAPEALDYVDPIPWPEKKANQTKLNRASEAASRFRDRNIIRTIANALQKYDRVFVLYGSSHAFMQESAIRKIFEFYNK